MSSNCACPTVYYGSGSATGSCPTDYNTIVEATATATATSTQSQTEANTLAENLASQLALQTATHDANIVNQTITAVIQNGIGGGGSGNSNFQAVIASGATYNLATPGSSDPKVVQIFNANPNAYTSFSNGGLNAAVRTMVQFGNFLFVGGDFNGTADGTIKNLFGIAVYELTTGTWSALPNNGLNGSVYCMKVVGNDIYIGGSFPETKDSSISSNNIIIFTPGITLGTGTWTAVICPNSATGTGGLVYSIEIFNTDLYIGGNFTYLGDGTTQVNNIAKYSPTATLGAGTWSDIASPGSNVGVSAAVYCIKKIGTNLYIGGSFTTAGTTTVNRIVIYTPSTTTWTPITISSVVGLNGSAVAAILEYNGIIYISGTFTGNNDSSVISNNVIKYTPSGLGTGSWTVMPNGGLEQHGYGIISIIEYNGIIYFAGNSFGTYDNTIKSYAFISYNPTTNTFSALPNKGIGISDANGYFIYLYNNKLLLGNSYADGNINTPTPGIPNIKAILMYNPLILFPYPYLNINYNSNTITTIYAGNYTTTLYYYNNTWNLPYNLPYNIY